MGWYRCHQRFAGLVALFALGVQLAVSFGHVHLEGARSPFGVSVFDVTSQEPPAAGTPYAPDAPHRDYCAVCVAIGLLSNGLGSEPPVTTLPELVWFALVLPASEYRISSVRFHPFRTRAPPAA